MKTAILTLCIVPWLLTGCGSTQSVARTTTTQDGVTSVTEVPVMSPEDAAFHDLCKSVSERKFDPAPFITP